MPPLPAPTCDLRGCDRPGVYAFDSCRVCKEHVDLAFVARVPSARSLLRYFPWLWRLTPERLNAFYDESGEAWEETHGDGTPASPPDEEAQEPRPKRR